MSVKAGTAGETRTNRPGTAGRVSRKPPPLTRFARGYIRGILEDVRFYTNRKFTQSDLSPDATKAVERMCRVFLAVCQEWVPNDSDSGYTVRLMHARRFDEPWNRECPSARFVDATIEALPRIRPYVGEDGKIHLKEIPKEKPEPNTPVVTILMENGQIDGIVADREIVVISRDFDAYVRRSNRYRRLETLVDKAFAHAHVEVFGDGEPEEP